MRIAFSCDDDRGLDGVMAHHFGRCPYYAFVDVDNGRAKEVKVVANPFYGQHAPGVVLDFIHSQGANVMITEGAFSSLEFKDEEINLVADAIIAAGGEALKGRRGSQWETSE